jgi:hypothetical protein
VVSISLTSLSFPGSVYNVGCKGCPPPAPTPTPTPVKVLSPSSTATVPTACGGGAPKTTTTIQSVGSACEEFIVLVGKTETETDSTITWHSVPIVPGSYTLKALLDEINMAVSEAVHCKVEFSCHPNTGFVTITRGDCDDCDDDDESVLHIAFPPSIGCVNRQVNSALRTNRATVADPGPTCLTPCPRQDLISGASEAPMGLNTVIGTVGLGPALGFGHYTYAEAPAHTSDNNNITPLCLPKSGHLTFPQQFQTVPLFSDSQRLYFVLEDSTHNSYPTFVGSRGESTMSGSILAEFMLPAGSATTVCEYGDHLATGFPYNTREYFGPTDLERLRVKVVNAQGDVVDTHGRPFAFCLKLDRVYNM